MSTRATYRFEGASDASDFHAIPPITFYIHHDGYPEGAAFYLWQMHHATSCDREPAACFLRGNERAELTSGHEAHGDTEYRYTLRGSTLTAYKRYGFGESERWDAFSVGPWHEFVNEYGPGMVTDFTPLRAIAGVYDYSGKNAVIYSRPQITAALEKARAELESYRERFPQYVGNIAGHEATVRRWERALDSYDAQDPAPATANG